MDSQSDITTPYVSKKAERRARQRAANPMRAEKMRKARLEKPLPKVEAEPPALNIGCSGWFYWDWKGLFYPTQMPTNQWFPHYAESFDTVEINASFYSWPTVAGVKAWMRGLPDRPFYFTVKANELITHVKRFEDTAGLVEDFGYVGDLLGEHMGCLLFQLPPSVKYDADLLKSIVAQMEAGRRNVVEFRHKSWWRDEVYTALRDAGVMFCATSGPKLPDDLVRTADEIYVRFHGVDRWYNYRYSDAELAQWAEKIRESGAKRVWVYFNNDYHGNAIDNARALREMLNK
jgi:uncharacterized protein YecE (DUF72 family)